MLDKIYDKLNELKTEEVINRILMTVENSEALKVSTQISNLPALFVYPIGLSAGTIQDRPNRTEQQVINTIGVLIALPTNQLTTKKTKLGLGDLTIKIKEKLFGWQPDGAFDSISYSGGSFISSENKILFFETQWTVTQLWQST